MEPRDFVFLQRILLLMKQKLSDEQIHAIKKVLDKAIEEGSWNESTFLIRTYLQ